MWVRSAPLGLLLAIQGRIQADERGSVCANVVLIRSKLAALSRDSLQLFLRWSIGITDVHQQAVFTDANTVELANDLIADVSAFKSASR